MTRAGILALLLVAACAGDGSAPEGYCGVIDEACTRQLECHVPVIGTERSREACAAGCASVLGLIADTPVAVADDRLEGCRAALREADCELLAGGQITGLEACRGLLRGTLPEGAACTVNLIADPCVPGLVCSAGGEQCGTCAIEPPACIEGSCPPGEYCDSAARCVPQRQLGERCELLPLSWSLWDPVCVDGTYCGWLDRDDQGPPHCLLRALPGATCPPIMGPTYACADGESCVFAACVPQRAAGEPCGSYTDCAPGLACTGVCTERKPEGASCGIWVGECGPGLACRDGRCRVAPPPFTPPEPGTARRPILAAGADCGSGDGVCPLGTSCLCADLPGCATQTCAPAPALGESCAARDEDEELVDPYRCASGVCDILETFTCVEPQAPGAACGFEELTFTAQCASLLCERGRCRGLVEERCGGR